MMTRIWLMTGALFVTTAAGSAESMRCSHRLVTDGDPKVKVADLCGQPTHKEQRTVVRSGIPRRNLNLDGNRRESFSDAELLIHNRSFVEVVVDVWVYNYGKRRLMREVVFEDSRIVEINVLGRGY